MRVVDVLYSLPYIFLVILLLRVLRTQPAACCSSRSALVQWLTMARIVRGQVLSLKHQNFVEAARALGADGRRASCSRTSCRTRSAR